VFRLAFSRPKKIETGKKMSKSKRTFNYLCAKPKKHLHFDQKLSKRLEKVVFTLILKLYQIKLVLNYFLGYIILSNQFLLVFCCLFILIFNFVVVYSFLFLLFLVFMFFYFWLFFWGRNVNVKKWVCGVDPHLFGWFVKKFGMVVNMIFDVLKLFELKFCMYGVFIYEK
jgi:hypothetical protein